MGQKSHNSNAELSKMTLSNFIRKPDASMRTRRLARSKATTKTSYPKSVKQSRGKEGRAGKPAGVSLL